MTRRKRKDKQGKKKKKSNESKQTKQKQYEKKENPQREKEKRGRRGRVLGGVRRPPDNKRPPRNPPQTSVNRKTLCRHGQESEAAVMVLAAPVIWPRVGEDVHAGGGGGGGSSGRRCGSFGATQAQANAHL